MNLNELNFAIEARKLALAGLEAAIVDTKRELAELMKQHDEQKKVYTYDEMIGRGERVAPTGIYMAKSSKFILVKNNDGNRALLWCYDNKFEPADDGWKKELFTLTDKQFSVSYK